MKYAISSLFVVCALSGYSRTGLAVDDVFTDESEAEQKRVAIDKEAKALLLASSSSLVHRVMRLDEYLGVVQDEARNEGQADRR